MSVEQILEMNEKREPRTFVMEKTFFTYAAGLRSVAALSQVFSEGLYWKIENDRDQNGLFNLMVVGHMKGDFHISPEFFSFMMNMKFPTYRLDKGDNYVNFAMREKMNEYTLDQFATEEKIAAYMEQHDVGERISTAITVGGDGCMRPVMILHLRY